MLRRLATQIPLPLAFFAVAVVVLGRRLVLGWLQWHAAAVQAAPSGEDQMCQTLLGLNKETRFTWREWSKESGAEVKIVRETKGSTTLILKRKVQTPVYQMILRPKWGTLFLQWSRRFEDAVLLVNAGRHPMLVTLAPRRPTFSY